MQEKFRPELAIILKKARQLNLKKIEEGHEKLNNNINICVESLSHLDIYLSYGEPKDAGLKKTTGVAIKNLNKLSEIIQDGGETSPIGNLFELFKSSGAPFVKQMEKCISEESVDVERLEDLLLKLSYLCRGILIGIESERKYANFTENIRGKIEDLTEK